MATTRRTLLNRALTALLMSIPFRKPARAVGSGFGGNWHCEGVYLSIVQSGEEIQVTLKSGETSQFYAGRLSSPTMAEGQGCCMVLSGDILTTTYVTGETAEFYRVS